MTFVDRTDAGVQLAASLTQYRTDHVVVYALPRGGVAVAQPVAKSLGVPIELLITRKVGHPLMPEFAIAAVTQEGPVVTQNGIPPGIDPLWFEHAVAEQRIEAKRRQEVYLAGKQRELATGKTAILIDDGLATGLTMRAAIQEIRNDRPKRIVIATPVSPAETYMEIAKEVDEITCLHIVAGMFGGIGSYYRYFPQLGDEEVIHLLQVK